MSQFFPPLDDIDKQLLRELQRDGRATFAALGEVVALTPPAVKARIEKLRAQGVLDIVAVTDPIQLGYDENAIVGVRVDGDARVVADTISKIPNVAYLVMTVGGYDLMVELVCHSRDQFDELHHQIRAIEGVRSTDAFPYTRIHTHRFSWGVPD